MYDREAIQDMDQLPLISSLLSGIIFDYELLKMRMMSNQCGWESCIFSIEQTSGDFKNIEIEDELFIKK